MDINEVNAKIKEFLKFQQQYVSEDAPDVMGTEAVKHYKNSFVDEGFTDEILEPWREVERRKPESKWYGFSYKSNSAIPGKKAKKGNAKSNFSPARTNDKILTGETNELSNSISYVKKTDRVTVRSDKPYSKIQNEGGLGKVFGKSSFIMPARPFIRDSKQLREKIIAKFKRDVQSKRKELGL